MAENASGLGISSLNVYISLVVNGVEPDAAWDKAREFGDLFGRRPTPVSREEAEEFAEFLRVTRL